MPPLATFLLVSLRALGERGGSAELLLTHARANGYDTLTAPMLERELRALADRSAVHAYDQPITGRRWRISSLGLSQLAEAAL